MFNASANAYTREELLPLSQEELIDIVLTKQSASKANEDSHASSLPLVNAHTISPDQYNTFCRQVSENFPNGAVAILDRQFTYLHAAGQEPRRFSLTADSFAGQSVGVLVSEEEAQRIKENFQRVFEGEICKMETTINEETYIISAIPLLSEDGTIDRLLAVSQNITERNAVLRKAQESEDQFRTLAESIPGAVYLTTSDTKREIVYFNGKIETLCGYTAEDFLEGRANSRMLMHPEDQAWVKPALKEAVANDRPYHFTYRWKHKEGHTCWIEEYGSSITKNQKQYFQGVLFDVSEKKQREQELQKQNDDLKKANAELDHFAYSVSHDLRAPLTSAMGLLYLLKTEKDETQRDHFIGVIEQSLLRLDNFVQEIIHLTKNARTELKVETIHLKSMIDEVIASQKYSADYDQVAIRTEVSQTEDFCTDSRRLWIILNNLVSNAIRYHFPLRKESYVRVVATVTQQELVLSVTDNGIGIQQEHLEKIFDMFYRATDRKSGSGLGLYLVKETVERLEGSVSVVSTYEEGTTFTIILPSLELLSKGERT